MQGCVQGAEKKMSMGVLQAMERDLHDLCQPVTSLQCRLELGKLCGGDALLEAVNGALEDSARIFAAVTRMRERLLAAAGCEDGESL